MTQPNALFLADILEDGGKPADIAEKCAAELRRLHAELERCKQVCAATSEAWREEAALAEPVVNQQLTTEPVQEPVAWIDDSGHPKHLSHLQSATERRLYGPLRPLYTTPPPAEPVQESAICDECGKSKHDGWALYCVKCVEPMFGLQRPAEPVQEPVCAHGVGKTKCSFCSVEDKQPMQEPKPGDFDHAIGADRFKVVRGAFWWHVLIGDSPTEHGKFRSRAGAEKMAADLLREFRNGAFVQHEAALAEPAQQGCDHCNQPLYAAIKCRVCGRVTSAEPPCATRECMPSECPNCASLEAQNSELDQKLAEMERKLLELQAAVFRSQGIGN